MDDQAEALIGDLEDETGARLTDLLAEQTLVGLLLFGGGSKISNVMGDFAKGIKAFKKGLKEDEVEPPPPPAQTIEGGSTTRLGKGLDEIDQMAAQAGDLGRQGIGDGIEPPFPGAPGGIVPILGEHRAQVFHFRRGLLQDGK